MRGADRSNGQLFSYVDIESRIHPKHPLRLIREVVNDCLAALSPEFERLYAREGRPSIPPERLLRALLLQAFYSIRSERLLMEQMEFNGLYRWFVGLNPDDMVWAACTFSKNRDRLLEADVSVKLLQAVIAHPRVKRLLSKEHFSVDGTLIDAWASMKSFRRKDGFDDDAGPGRNAERGFRDEKRSNETHASTTDPDARLYRKGKGRESRLCYMGHALMENRSGLAVAGCLTQATGHAEREAALAMLAQHHTGKRRVSLAGDKGYDAAEFVQQLRARTITPHIAIQGYVTKTGKRRKTAIDRRTTRHPGYALSQIVRKRIEEIFGWAKTSAGMAKTRFKGRNRVAACFMLGLTAYNLIRLPKLLAAPA